MALVYPIALTPSGMERVILPSGREIRIPKTSPCFRKWALSETRYSFGNKAFIDYHGEGLFAEVVVLKMFLCAGWQGRWVETYGAAKMKPRFLTRWDNSHLESQVNSPIEEQSILQRIRDIAVANNSSYSGCPDVLVWKRQDIMFVELKRKGKDRIRRTQTRWLEAALFRGLKEDNFLIAEWDLIA